MMFPFAVGNLLYVGNGLGKRFSPLWLSTVTLVTHNIYKDVIDIYSTVYIQYCISIHILYTYSTGNPRGIYRKFGVTGKQGNTQQFADRARARRSVGKWPLAKSAIA